MEPELDVDPGRDDLPLRANTNHMLVRHYALDLTVLLQEQLIRGSVVLFLEPLPAGAGAEATVRVGATADDRTVAGTGETSSTAQKEGTTQLSQTNSCWESTSQGDFTLVLDCCDLVVFKVEEVDVSSVPDMSSLFEAVGPEGSEPSTDSQPAVLVQRLIALPSHQWRRQLHLYSQCSQAPAYQGGGPLLFHTDCWSLQVRKRGAGSPQGFPRALRVSYETKPEGGSVRWTRDQDHRMCVYTAGSPINNRALFPCQEPAVAMSTWQARVQAPQDCMVLLSGENQALPTHNQKTGSSSWEYYVTMPMPASTFTLAVGHWLQATPDLSIEGERRGQEEEAWSGALAVQAGSIPCSHGDYPCRFTDPSAWRQWVVPHRVFAPPSLLPKARKVLLPLLPRCLAAARGTLGVHPFPRIDLLIVPAGFSSLGMASPHMVFLSQSVLDGGEGGLTSSVCGSRLCHELAHSWFGLAIGARDWTEEWISEGFATFLEDIIWGHAQQLSGPETEEQSKLKALLRWRRLADELRNSEEELQILRPNQDNTGLVSESGSSMVKHALNPEKTFMQVHYLKGYFLLRFLASHVREQPFLSFLRLFVRKYHGQLILSQDFLHLLLCSFPDLERQGLTLKAIYADWLDGAGIPKWLVEGSAVWSQARLVEEVKEEVVKWILPSSRGGKGRKRKRSALPKVNHREMSPEQLVLLLDLLLEEEELSVKSLRLLQRTYNLQNQGSEARHRWCELVVQHKHTQAYGDVENFLVHDQAMGVYLYGELMVHEDAQQQTLARRCPLIGPGRNGPISTPSGGGDGPVATQERRQDVFVKGGMRSSNKR
ncbi:aminopeptidase O [Osmerus mordax]|uniref:aminopeptidase O n=1 Tax=Osmerus mordax TaxID=8014 RepID=UPI003510768D